MELKRLRERLRIDLETALDEQTQRMTLAAESSPTS
jgi:hypothetical protein